MDTRKLLLKVADIESMAGERKVHFLNPNAVRINKSLGDAIGLNHLGVHIIYVEPGRHHGHHHHGGGQSGSSFMGQLAQSIITDIQKATGSGATSGAGSSDASAQASTNGDSFLDKLASKIAGDLLTTYQQAGGAAGTSAQSSTGNQVNATA